MFVLGVPKVLSGGVNKIFGEKKFIGVPATQSWEKSRIFRYKLLKDLLSKGQKTTAPPNPMAYRVKEWSMDPNVSKVKQLRNRPTDPNLGKRIDP